MPGKASVPAVWAGEFRRAEVATLPDGTVMMTRGDNPVEQVDVSLLVLDGSREVPLSIRMRSDVVNGTVKGQEVVIRGRVAINDKGYPTNYGNRLVVGQLAVVDAAGGEVEF